MIHLMDMPYKGSRTYIHGSDLFNNISNLLPELLNQEKPYISQLSFSTFSYNLCNLVFDETLDTQTIMGKGKITLDDGSQKAFYLHKTEEIPSRRVPFNEEDLVALAKYTNQSVELKGESPFTSIETIIALTKALSYKNMPLQEGKWVFGRIDLNTPLTSIKSSIIIECTNSVAGRFSVNDITIDDQPVGKIQFIVGTP